MYARNPWLALALLLSASSNAVLRAADVNLGTAFTYQGTLRASGVPASGAYDFRFTLWDAVAAGSQTDGPLNANGVDVNNGLFAVELDFGFGVFTGAARWLQVEVRTAGGGSFTTLSGRQALTAAPYALALRLPYYGTQTQNGASFGITNPHSSGTAGYFHCSATDNDFEAVIGINAGGGAGVRGTSAGGLGRGVSGEATGNSGSGVYGQGYYGLRGRTTSATGYGLYVSTDNGGYGYLGRDGRALYAYNGNNANAVIGGDDDFGLLGTTNGVSYFLDAGVVGRSESNFGTVGTSDTAVGAMGATGGGAVWYQPDSGTAGYSADGQGICGMSTTGTGVYGLNRDSNNYGRLGHATYGLFARSYNGDGVLGRTSSTASSVAGVRGEVTSTSPGSYSAGVRGENSGTSGLGIGVWGSHDGSGWGVLGESPAGVGVYGLSASGYAGYFSGNVTVTGALAKGGGSFKIDHPLDPENKYLSHSFVESPDMMNIYNGNVVTDEDGSAWIEMPDWFEPLNRDFRYQLTVIGQFAQAIVAEKMVDSRFRIRTDKPFVEVSWQVTGIRHDPWANANRIQVEQMKSPAQRGKYLHAEAYDQPKSMSIDYRPLPQPRTSVVDDESDRPAPVGVSPRQEKDAAAQ